MIHVNPMTFHITKKMYDECILLPNDYSRKDMTENLTVVM